tara:strand:+ start:152 stop:517 length:366 start_codon:yes stop_codon:yes gene_type:complete
MSQKFKIIFLFTLFIFALFITTNIITEKNLQEDGWYSIAIMYFFSFSFFQTSILEKSFNKRAAFVKSHLFLTGIKMFLSAVFIIIYGLIKGDHVDMFFFIWFFVLYLLYTFLLAWLFYKKS